MTRMISKTSSKLSPVYALLLLLLLCSTMMSSMVAAQNQEARAGHSNNTSTRCIESERQALLQFKQGLVDHYAILSSWGNINEEDQYHHQDCCQWRGVGCSNATGNIISLDLRATQYNESGSPICLQGNISDSLLVLEHLNYLDLSGNDFLKCPIPDFIGSLAKLTYLNLSNSNFSGEIPAQFKNISNLESLDLSHYNFLHAESFAWAASLSSLKTLNLRDVQLTNATDWVHVINSLPSLTNLNLAYCSLPNLSSISQVNASKSLSSIHLGGNNLPATSVYPWLFNISSSLVEVILSFNWLEGPIPEEFDNMNSLSHLDLSFNNLQGPIPEAIVNLSSLSYLDLSGNQLQGPIPTTFRSSASLSFLDLSSNELQGPIPEGIGSLSSLQLLALSSNKLEDGIPISFRNLCSLKELYLSGNNLSGDLLILLRSLSGCITKSLEALSLGNNSLPGSLSDFKGLSFPSLIYLDLSYNQLNGSFPSFSNFPSLVSLYFQNNQLTGSLPEDFGQLSQLQWVDLSSNFLNGTIHEAHFSNLFQLCSLHLSFNNLLAFNISPNWTPPFQLLILSLDSCRLGPRFPYWLQTQNAVDTLTISDAGISDTLPEWFFKIFRVGASVNLSHNEIRGELPNSGLQHFVLRELDLSFNSLEGSIPTFLTQVGYLELSNNKLSGSISSWCQRDNKLFSLQFLGISYNNLSGQLPDCWMDINTVKVLNLGSNRFSGTIPSSLGNLIFLEVLNLGANELSGEVPSSLKNCTSLRILDLSANSLTGPVPSWLGDNLLRLNILILRQNKFSGNFPLEICHLPYLQIMDLSINNIFGTIPSCLYNITDLSNGDNLSATANALNSSQWTSAKVSYFTQYIIGTYLIDKVNIYAYLVWKGSTREYWQNLALVRSIDLSSNNFSGEIPAEISSLTGLQSLNLSRNHLTGPINPNIGQLRHVESLDLSRNQLSGRIPSSFSELNFLSFLDLSYNNLSGKIPLSTQLQSFNESSYVGNDGLCGSPLQQKCQDDGAGASPHNAEEVEDQDDEDLSEGLYISIGLGFATGFWGVFGILLFKKSWRRACFRFCSCLYFRIVASVVHITRLTRCSRA